MGQSKERNSNEKSGFLKKLIIVLAVAIVVVFAVFYVIYYRFSYQRTSWQRRPPAYTHLAMAERWLT